eukprot:jgi/Psemu1/6981/gm1.6981_g
MTNRNSSNANTTTNTVRFSSTYVPEHHRDLDMGTKRSAWDSDEHSQCSKHRDRLALPPRRPTRERNYLNDLPDDSFVSSSEAPQGRMTNETRKGKPLVRKSILKISKYSTTIQTKPQCVLPNEPQHPGSPNSILFDDIGTPSSTLTRNHRDSVLDLHRLACEKKQCQASIGDESITIPSILNIDVMDGDTDDHSSSTLNGSYGSFGSNPPLLDLVLEI